MKRRWKICCVCGQPIFAEHGQVLCRLDYLELMIEAGIASLAELVEWRTLKNRSARYPVVPE